MLLAAHRGGGVGERLAAELADVEARFSAELLSDLGCVNELVGHVERYRGKMLRPSLVLVTASAVAPDAPRCRPEHVVVATVVEMVHMATLVHDDILDDATVRRRGATVNHLSGNEAAVMLGDYLISHAYHLCSSLDDQRLARAVAETTNTVCEGELLQLANRRNWRLDERTYFEIIRRKTASLTNACCRLAAQIGGANAATATALGAYGEKLGIAFQIIDDVLDLVGDVETVGKTLGRDLDKGKLTLPLIRYLSGAPATEVQEFEAIPDEPGDMDRPDPARDRRIARLRARVEESDALEYAREWAGRLVEDAKAAVRDTLSESPAKAMMLDMADAVVRRRF